MGFGSMLRYGVTVSACMLVAFAALQSHDDVPPAPIPRVVELDLEDGAHAGRQDGRLRELARAARATATTSSRALTARRRQQRAARPRSALDGVAPAGRARPRARGPLAAPDTSTPATGGDGDPPAARRRAAGPNAPSRGEQPPELVSDVDDGPANPPQTASPPPASIPASAPPPVVGDDEAGGDRDYDDAAALAGGGDDAVETLAADD